MAFLEVGGVSKSFGPIRALDNVTFEVSKGEYLCILGPTGAGKTTLLRIISGLLEPDEGEVYIEGVNVTQIPPEERNVAYMPQGYALFPHMTVWENVVYGASIKGLSEERARDALRRVGLLHRVDSYPNELSGGQQQRVALARVLAAGGKLLLLDEPLSALDLLLNIELRYELRKLAKKLGLTVIHVTHSAEEAMSISDKIIVLRRGRIQQIGKPEEIYHAPSNLFVANFIGEINIIEGIVRDIHNGYFTVESKTVGILKVRGKPPGGVVVLGYRPESIIIYVEKPFYEENLYKAIVEEVEFHGVKTRIHLTTIRGLKLIADLWFKPVVKIRSGSIVYVKLPEDSAIVFRYPREGIIKAISLE